jgi:hypothetical protein
VKVNSLTPGGPDRASTAAHHHAAGSHHHHDLLDDDGWSSLSSDCELLFTVKCQYWLLPVLPASVLFLYDRLTDNGKTSGETYLLP